MRYPASEKLEIIRLIQEDGVIAWTSPIYVYR